MTGHYNIRWVMVKMTDKIQRSIEKQLRYQYKKMYYRTRKGTK